MNSTETAVTVAPTTAAAGRSWSFTNKLRNKVAGVLASLAAMLYVIGGAGAANAAAPGTDLLGGAEDTFFGSISGFLTGSLLPLVFVLAAVVIGAGMLIRYGRKATSS